MGNKLEQRKRMKRAAMLRAAGEGAATVAKTYHAHRKAPPLVQVLLTHSARWAAESRVQAIQQTPIKWFRADRPKVDPRRKRRFGYRGCVVQIVHAGRQCGKTARLLGLDEVEALKNA